MKSFKQFLLAEALNREQKVRLSILHDPEPRPAAISLGKNIYPDDQTHTINIPLTHDTKGEIEQHLGKHGIKIKNYNTGEGEDARGRKVSIGSVLKASKTAADPKLVSGFENDQRQTNPNPATHYILNSRLPEHVGECSTNKGWKSCAGLTPSGKFVSYGGGEAARKLSTNSEIGRGGAIQAGSNVAYLMKHGEIDPDKSDARILIHPYHVYDKDGNITHSALMPENKVYSRSGGKHSNFTNSLEDFYRKKYPMAPGLVYRKHPDVYDDDKNPVRFDTSPKSVKQILLGNKLHRKDKEFAVQNLKLPSATISSILKEPKTPENRMDVNEAHQFIAQHQKLSPTHFKQLLDMGHIQHLASNQKLTNSQISDIANHKPEQSNTGNAEDDELMNYHKNHQVNMAHHNLIETHKEKLNAGHINNILDSNAEYESNMIKSGHNRNRSGSSPIAAIYHQMNRSKLTPEHIEKLKKSNHEMAPSISGEDYDDWAERTKKKD